MGTVLDKQGYPVSCEIWPGNTADVSSLLPVAKRLKNKFGIENFSIVPDRGMISGSTFGGLENKEHPRPYILGADMNKQKEIGTEVLTRAGRYHVVS